MDRSTALRLAAPAALLTVGCLSWAQSSVPSRTKTYAIVGARIEIGDGRSLEKGTIVVQDGLITAVAPDAAVPAGADVLDGKGLTVYPGFIDAYTHKCYTAPAAPESHDPAESVPSDYASAFMKSYGRYGIHPEAKAIAGLNLTADTLKPFQAAGFTTAYILPSDGDLRGSGVVVNLSGRPIREAVVAPDFGQTMSLRGDGNGSGYPSSLMGHIAQLRQTLLDAQWYAKVQAAYASGNGHRPPYDDSLSALQDVFSGRSVSVFEAQTENPIVRALDLSHEFGLKLLIAGGKEAWKQSAALKSAGVPVLLSLGFDKDPQPEKPKADSPSPTEFDTPPNPLKIAEKVRLYQETLRNAAELYKAGVAFGFGTEGCKDPGEFFSNLRKAVEAGLPRDAALRSLTLDSAKILGVERQLGSVEVGKTANLTVMTGDFLKAESKVKAIYVDGIKIEPDKKEAAPSPRFNFNVEGR